MRKRHRGTGIFASKLLEQRSDALVIEHIPNPDVMGDDLRVYNKINELVDVINRIRGEIYIVEPGSHACKLKPEGTTITRDDGIWTVYNKYDDTYWKDVYNCPFCGERL